MIIHELSIKYIYNHQPDFVNHYHGKCYVIYHIYPHMISVISSILIIIIAYLVGDVRDSSRVSYLSAGGRSAAGKPMRAATARRETAMEEFTHLVPMGAMGNCGWWLKC